MESFNRWSFMTGFLHLKIIFSEFVCIVEFSSAAQSCPTLCDPMSHSTPGLPIHHQLPEITQTHAHHLVMPSNHLILCCPLLLLPPIPPSIRVFSNESTLRMRWPKYWSFNFSISLSNEHIIILTFLKKQRYHFADKGPHSQS